MRDALATLLTYALIAGAGACIRSLLRVRREEPLRAVSGSIILGLASCGVLGPTASLLGLDVPCSAAGGLAGLIVIGLLRGAGRYLADIARGFRFAAPLLLSLLLPLILVGLHAIRWPVLFGDEVYVWGYKAARIWSTGSIDPTGWTSWVARGPGYPPALPVAASIHAALAGGFSVASTRAIAFLAYVSFAAAMATLAGLRFAGVRRVLVAFGLAALPIALFQAPLFMGDITFTAAIALVVVHASDRPRSILTGAHVLSLSLIRIEGGVMALLAVAVLASSARRGKRLRTAAAQLSALASLLLPWVLVLLTSGLNPITGEPRGSAERLSELHSVISMPSRLFSQFCSAQFALFAELAPRYSSWTVQPLAESQLGFAFLMPALLCLVASRPLAGALRFPRRWILALCAALLLGQVLPLALTPLSAYHVAMVRARAALHLVPVIFLAAAAIRAPRDIRQVRGGAP